MYVFPQDFKFEKTQSAVEILNNLQAKTGVKNKQNVIIYAQSDKEFLRGFVNTDVTLINAENLKISPIANSKNLILTQSAQTILEARFEKK